MNDDTVDRKVARRSAAIYLPISISTALVFLLGASVLGNYPPVARFGGAVWVGVLSLIVSMPLVTARAKSRARRRQQ